MYLGNKMSQEFIDYMKKNFAQSEGDLYEAVYWVWDAVNKPHGNEVRKVLYGDTAARRISRLDFKNFFSMVHTAIEEFNAEKNDKQPSMKHDFASQAADLSPQALFEVPSLTVSKVSRDEILNMLRSTVNKGYMPSSVRVGFNSKPNYVRVDNMPTFRRQLAREREVGFYTANDELFFKTSKEVGIWAALPIDNQVTIFVNLTTDEVYIGRGEEYVLWDDDRTIAIDRNALLLSLALI